MSCEKASRRLRYLIAKAKRLGLTTDEVVDLPAAKKLLSTRVTSSTTWTTTIVMIILILGGSALLVFLCSPCITTNSRT